MICCSTATTMPMLSTSFIAGLNNSVTGTFSFLVSSSILFRIISISLMASSFPLAFFITSRASSNSSFMISQRGLRGTRNRPKKYSRAGRVSNPSIQRQLYSSNFSACAQEASDLPNCRMR